MVNHKDNLGACNRCDKPALILIMREAHALKHTKKGYTEEIDSWELEPHGNEYMCVECYEGEYGSIGLW